MRKYHADIYLPPEARDLEFATMLTYTRHARKAARDDRYGRINLPTVFDSRKARLIEAVTEAGKVVKGLFRLPHDERHDLCIVVLVETGKVLTVWLNERSDKHHTLDRSQYATV